MSASEWTALVTLLWALLGMIGIVCARVAGRADSAYEVARARLRRPRSS